jgi:hypothetical protein
VGETLISASIALQMAAKCLMLSSITKIKQMIGEKNAKDVVGTVTVPEMTKIYNKSC